jgi:hypothetical protein
MAASTDVEKKLTELEFQVRMIRLPERKPTAAPGAEGRSELYAPSSKPSRLTT